ncbi:MAG TPA: hypothetical protein VEG38_08420 [Acidimicrobiia bacterium]|nr:hypothetical protein [Acidimicrobiia bacterium]
MTRRIAALAAVTVAVATVFLPCPAASAQVCQPPTAEHAFEELLDLAPDESPLEDRAWRIADEQEAKGAFETSDTIRRIDDLARASGYAFDCADRMYHPVSGPDPREAIKRGEDVADDALEAPAAGDGRPGPGAEGSPPDGEFGDAQASGATPTGQAASAGPAGRDTTSGNPTGSTRLGGTVRSDGVAAPDDAADGERAAETSTAGTGSDGLWRNVGIGILAAAAVVGFGRAARMARRRRRPHVLSEITPPSHG